MTESPIKCQLKPIIEDELEVDEDLVKDGDAKIKEHKELKAIENSLKSMDVSDEKTNQRVQIVLCRHD